MSKQTRKTIIAGNWKMNKTRKAAQELVEAIVAACAKHNDLPEIVVCPPFTALPEVLAAAKGSGVSVGAQTMDYHPNGAFTGEISPPMLTDLAVKYVIIGHSERRQFFAETNASVNLKLKAALEHKLVPIVCVGETLDERDSDLTDNVIRHQVAAALADVAIEIVDPIVFAYEPVWAIGTGKTCEAAEANRVCHLIRTTIDEYYQTSQKGAPAVEMVGSLIPILYGGSVKASNVDEILSKEHVDGALVGGASLTVEDFMPLILSAQKRKQGALSSRAV